MQTDTYTQKTLTTAEKMERITRALADLDQQIDDLHAQVAALDAAGTCTGRIQSRKDKGRTPKPYAQHNHNQSCPNHGTPKPGKRLRIYVGLDPHRQAEAQAAIDRYKQKAVLEQQIEQIEIKVSLIERAISNAYYAASNHQRWEM